MFDPGSDMALPPPPPPPITEPAAADDWGPPDPSAVAEALEQRSSAAMYTATDYEVQAALSAPPIATGQHQHYFTYLFIYLILPLSPPSLCLGGAAVKALECRSSSREFDSQLGRYQVT